MITKIGLGYPKIWNMKNHKCFKIISDKRLSLRSSDCKDDFIICIWGDFCLRVDDSFFFIDQRNILIVD